MSLIKTTGENHILGGQGKTSVENYILGGQGMYHMMHFSILQPLQALQLEHLSHSILRLKC